jgi:twitching motility protein PilJ
MYYGRSVVFYFQGNYDRAIADMDQVTRLQPDNAEAYLLRGMFYMEQGTLDKARLDYQKVLELTQDPQLRGAAEEGLKTIGVN